MPSSSNHQYRNTRRNDPDNSSGSQTRSSSRTTSGNTNSSKFASRSPSLERFNQNDIVDKCGEESNFKYNGDNTQVSSISSSSNPRKRFLQRWDDEVGTSDKNEIPYIYQQAEFLRITQDIIRKCDAEDTLISFLRAMDEGETLDLSKVSDAQLRKKLRHLFKALYLERNNSKFKKPKECNISLSGILYEFLPYLKTKISAMGPYQRPVVQEAPKKKAHTETVTNETPELMSLREMHEQGFFVDYENIQKEFMNKHKQIDVWGKTPEEQLLLEKNKDLEQPWKVFDRERDLNTTKQVDPQTYHNLINYNKDNFN